MKNKLTVLALLIFVITSVGYAQAPAISPVDAGTGVVQTTTTFTWTDLAVGANANSYNFEIYTDAGYTTLLEAGQIFITGTTATIVTPLAFNTTYYWRVQDSDTDDNGVDNAAADDGAWVNFSFTTEIATPSLTTPANGALSQSVTPTLVWTLAGGTAGVTYDLQYYEGAGAFPGTTIAGITSPYSATTFTANSTVTWRIVAHKALEADKNSTPFTFGTIPPAPTIIAPSPANFAVGVSVLPQFAWTGAVGVTGYEFVVSLTDGGADIGLNPAYAGGIVSTHDFSYVTTSSKILTNGTRYYWRVRQTTPAGTSDWTSREFVTVNAAKPTINPIYPGVTSAYVGWYPVPYSSGLKYDVLFSTNATMAGYTVVASDITNTYYTVTGLVQGTNYYVQVRAHNSTGSIVISYSTVSPSFTPAGPPMPIPSYPTNNADDGDIYANPPTLFWYIEGNEPALTYEIELYCATDPNYSTVFSADQGALIGTGFTSTKTFKKVPLTLIAGKTYTWHVRSVSGAVVSDWSSTATFTMYTTTATATIVPTPSWPVGNPTVYLNPPTLYWYLGSDKTGLYYEVELSLDGILVGGAGTAFATSIAVAGKSQDLFKALTSTLIPGQIYYWHVRSDLNVGAGGESDWSTSGSFTIASTASGAATTPIPSWPVGGAIVDGTMADILLTWTAYSTQALDFKVRMATSPSVDGSGMLNHGSAHELLGWVPTITSANATAVFGTLTAGATYYWQVMSELTGNTSVHSPWSMVASFSTAAGASSVVPLVVSPNYLQPLNNTTAVLTWNIPVQSESHLKYDLQYSKNENFTSVQTKADLNEPSTLVTGLEQNSTYYWRVLSKTDNGSVSSYSTTGSFKTSDATAVENQEIIPTQFELSQNYPNPFNPTTRINFAIPRNSFVSIKVYDMLGQEVKTLINQEMVSGNHSIDWNADNNLGIKVATGMYIYRITAGNFVSTKKMVLIK